MIQLITGSRAFILGFRRQSSTLKREFLSILSTKSHFQTLTRRGNRSKRGGTRDSRIKMFKYLDYSKYPRIHFPSNNTRIIRKNLGVAIGFGYSSSINGSDETLGCKSFLLSRVPLIEDGAFRYRYVSCEQEASRDLVHLIVNRGLRLSNGSPNLGRYNSSDERPRLICLIK